MKEPEKIPLTDFPRRIEPKKIPLIKIQYPESITDDIWEKHDTNCGPPIFAKKNENHNQNDSKSISELESDQTN
jgi:hypothetical protein